MSWTDDYNNNYSFVPEFGRDLMSILDVPKGSRVLDLGCGNGSLTQALTDVGYEAVGMDVSDDFLKSARARYPHLHFVEGNAVNFETDEPYDAIFSNAMLNWINDEDHPQMLKSVYDALRPGGEFVFECGGFGNNALIHRALSNAFASHHMKYQVPYYFPTIGNYATMLEKTGFRVIYAALLDRPTPLLGESGMRDWISMFIIKPFMGVAPDVKEKIINEAVSDLRSVLYSNKMWTADYVRLRMKAIRLYD